ncbi:MAG: helix-turn-helix domain-containing protein, partial [Streptococcus sp.]
LAMALHRQGITASTNASYFVKERLATHILNIEEQDIFQLSPSILSSSFGTSYRHVQRVIKQFIDQGIIEKKAFKTYRILQRDSLETLAFID